jgi:hypothetical protein
VPEVLVNLHEVLGNSRSYSCADRIEELDNHDPISHQIAVKAVLLACMVHQDDIRELVRVFPARVSVWTSPCTFVYKDRFLGFTAQRWQEAQEERQGKNSTHERSSGEQELKTSSLLWV